MNKYLNSIKSNYLERFQSCGNLLKFPAAFRKKFEDLNINTFPQNVLSGL